MQHLSFVELEKLKKGEKVPFRIRMHLFFCRQCRRELDACDWKLCDEIRKNYIQNEKQLKGGFEKT